MAPSLLSLPLEVKNEIYEYLLVSSRSYVYPYAWMSPYEQPTGMAGIGLLRVCKQIHAEASAMLYQKNTFMFENPAQLEWFMSQVSDKDINTVQSICLDFDGTQYPREATPTASSARPIVCEQDILAATMTNFRMFIYLMHLWIAPLCVLPESIKHISLDLDNSKFKGTCSHTLANPQFTDLVELVKLLGKERSRGVGIYTLEKNAQAIDAIEVKPMSINELADWHVQMEFLIAELDVDVQRLKRISRTFHEFADPLLDEVVANHTTDAAADQHEDQGSDQEEEKEEKGEEEVTGEMEEEEGTEEMEDEEEENQEGEETEEKTGEEAAE